MSRAQVKQTEIESQSIRSKKVESKRKFAGERLLEAGAGANLLRRAELARSDLLSLKERVEFDPFLEIGAGTGVRSVAVMREVDAEGAASDISLNTLMDASFAAILLQSTKIPVLICCDALHLPFKANTFRFVFAYRTLHHHPNPIPVVAESFRVLGRGGHFFFNEEPMDLPLRRFLRGGRTLSSPPSRIQRIAYMLRVEKVFWDDGRWERSVGITEARFERGLWIEALVPFERVEVTINKRLRLRSDLHYPRMNAWLAGWVGGNVRGICQKLSGEPVDSHFTDRLICLDCGRSLPWSAGSPLTCSGCGRVYPYQDGVLRVLPIDLEQELYADLESSAL